MKNYEHCHYVFKNNKKVTVTQSVRKLKAMKVGDYLVFNNVASFKNAPSYAKMYYKGIVDGVRTFEQR